MMLLFHRQYLTDDPASNVNGVLERDHPAIKKKASQITTNEL